MLIDMHIHTKFSPCSIIDLYPLVKRAQEVGLDGICITDHNTMMAKKEINKLKEVASGLFIVVGMEYSTSEGDFLVFLPEGELSQKLSVFDLYEYVNKRGGVIIPAHPFRRGRSLSLEILSYFSVIEVINGRNNQEENALSINWIKSRGNGIKGIGGSDAHTLEEVGRVVTYFKRNIYTFEDFLQELRSGNYNPLKRF